MSNLPPHNAHQLAEQPKRMKLPNDINRAVTKMIEIIEQLKESLASETLALKDADTKGFMALQDQKLEAAYAYQEGITQLLARKEELHKAQPELLRKLEVLRKDFAETAKENYAAIERMKNGMQRLSERIMEHARRAAAKQRQIVYGAKGHMQSHTKATMGISESA